MQETHLALQGLWVSRGCETRPGPRVSRAAVDCKGEVRVGIVELVRKGLAWKGRERRVGWEG